MRIRHLFIPALLSIAAFATAADKEVEDLLAKMRTAYKAIKTAKIVTKSEANSPNGTAEYTVEVTFKSPTFLHAKASGGELGSGEVVIRVDGKQARFEGPGGKADRAFNLDEVGSALPANLETLNFWDYERQLSTGPTGNMKSSTFKIVQKENWKKLDWIVLEETAKNQNILCRYFIDPKTYLMWRTVVMPIGSKVVRQDARIDKLEINPKVDDALFKIGE